VQKLKKLKLYLETSVWNFLFADDAPDKKALTEKLYSEIQSGKYSIFISEIVMREINNAEASKRKLLASEIVRFDPVVLMENSDSLELIQYYLENGLLTTKQSADLGHVAMATINEMDILVSWNMRHIVKRKTKVLVNALNQIRGYRTIEICTPEEVIDNDGD
jgi:hypothetical protein